ncbi:ABC transporter substrate-binding protein [Leuconostoc mesenteroides subsp. dextranicum]|nr:ABC transporter substrate-binding protein [Leuconostoc mesenteroides subsp. mesenteroides]KMY78394.1 ABC transporter substrate-binding protein [Leuconostoc mesenteroides subsp. mesenteroides]KMY81645.1 ABC transporter substrate-binding protein [Leuconostoc mesenteroides subsp. dextranicum]ORI89182.1 ABC transporter substrate-binding protein [Leuconostoc mesenteroides subsp. mesenteroides]ORI92171.1 ABC transporter substrate-binding protein [Leuconostoc mesenteroides subsp. mesenteroides]
MVTVGAGVNYRILSAKADTNQSGRTVKEIKKSGEIKIAVFGDLKPYGWVDKNGKRQGYDIELAKKVAKDLGVKVKYVQVNANARVDALNSGKVDLALANFTVTPERKKVIDFAKPYMKVSIGVASKKSKLITKVDQLHGKKLIVNKGTTAETYFTKNYTKASLLKFDSKTQQFAALKDGRADAITDDNSYLFAWVKSHPDYKVGIKKLGEQSYISPGVQKGNKSLLKWTDKEINKLNKNQFFTKDYDKTLAPYFGKDVKSSDITINN